MRLADNMIKHVQEIQNGSILLPRWEALMKGGLAGPCLLGYDMGTSLLIGLLLMLFIVHRFKPPDNVVYGTNDEDSPRSVEETNHDGTTQKVEKKVYCAPRLPCRSSVARSNYTRFAWSRISASARRFASASTTSWCCRLTRSTVARLPPCSPSCATAARLSRMRRPPCTAPTPTRTSLRSASMARRRAATLRHARATRTPRVRYIAIPIP